jgi:hypothetical protein
MIYPHSTRTAHLVKSLAAPGLTTDKIGKFAIGIVDTSRFTNQVTKTNLTGVKKAQFVYGSPNVGEESGSNIVEERFNSTESFKSPVFDEVVKWNVFRPRKAQPFIGYFGYNGTQQCDFPKYKCDSTVMVQVEARGTVVENLYQVPAIYETFSVNAPCCEGCPTGCEAAEVQCKWLFAELVNKMNDSKNKVSRFGTFSLVSSCTPAVPTVKFATTTWCLTLCDMGDNEALAMIMSQYPGLGIKRTKRVDNMSTYSVCTVGATAPASFAMSTLPVPANCDGTCPIGYTATIGGNIWTVKIDNANSDLTAAAWLTEVKTKFPTATKATKTSFLNGTSTYTVILPAAFVAPGVIPTETELYGPFGAMEVFCTPTTIPAPLAWVSCGTGFKTKKELCITLPLKDCAAATSNLSDVLAYYGTLGSTNVHGIDAISVKATYDCFEELTLTQWNDDCLTSDCDTEQLPHYTNVPGYKLQMWEECPCVAPVVLTDCKCGIKVVSKLVSCTPKSCGSSPDAYQEYDTAEFTISLLEDLKTCGKSLDLFYEAQKGLPLTLDGKRVLQDIILSRKYRDEMYADPTSQFGNRINEAMGYVHGVNMCESHFLVEVTTAGQTRSLLGAGFGEGSIHTTAFYFEDEKLMNDFTDIIRTLTEVQPYFL